MKRSIGPRVGPVASRSELDRRHHRAGGDGTFFAETCSTTRDGFIAAAKVPARSVMHAPGGTTAGDPLVSRPIRFDSIRPSVSAARERPSSPTIPGGDRFMRATRSAGTLAFAWLSTMAVALGQEPEGNARIEADELPQHIVKVLRTTNKAQTNRYISRVYDFKHVNPYAVIRFVRRVMEIEEGAWYSFANEDMKSGKLLVVCPEYQLEGLDQLMAVIDRPDLNSSGGDKRDMFQPLHRDVTDPNFVNQLALAATPSGIILSDAPINGMFLEDSVSGFDSIVQAWKEADVPTPSLEAIATVYEVDLTDDGQIGLDYVSWKNGPGRNLFAAGAFAQKEKVTQFDSDNTPGGLVYNSGKNLVGLDDMEYEHTGRNVAYMYNVPSAYFDFLAANGYGRTLTKSKLVAHNGSTALLEIGENVMFYRVNHAPDQRGGSRIAPIDPYGTLEPFTDTSATGESTDNAGARVVDHPDNRTVVPTLQSRALGNVQTGFFLQLTPSIHANVATIDLQMSFVNLTGYADDGTPVLSNRQAATRFRVPHDSREVTVGGMVRSRRVDGANQMPWLGDIPVLGYLFGGESQLDQKSMVIVTLKTRVMAFDEDNRSPEEIDAENKVAGSLDGALPTNNPGLSPN
jgi:hypothetical protein